MLAFVRGSSLEARAAFSYAGQLAAFGRLGASFHSVVLVLGIVSKRRIRITFSHSRFPLVCLVRLSRGSFSISLGIDPANQGP